MLEGRGELGRGAKEKKWDNYNRIINKIYFKNILVLVYFLSLEKN